MRVRFAVGAIRDLRAIFRHIVDDNPTAAAELVERIEHVATLIGNHPRMGHKTKRPAVKIFPVGKYLVVYEIADEEVIVQYVRHGARRRPWEGE